MTEQKKDKHDESRPSARLVVLMGLFYTGQDAGLLSLEALRTSPVSMAYAVALATAAFATLTFSLRARSEPAEGDAPRAGPVWHESTVFTDPWYQFPAVFCVFILFSMFVLDLIAEPPATDLEVWFLAALAISTLALAFGLTGGAESKKASKDDDGDKPTEAETPSGPQSPVEAALRDPWFSVPATSIFFLHFARDGLKQIREEPESLWTTVTLLMPVAAFVGGLVSFAVARARRVRKEREAVVDSRSVGATGDGGGSEV